MFPIQFNFDVFFFFGCSCIEVNKTNLISFFISFIFFRHMGSSTLAEKKSIEDATKIATESTSNIRTIASLRKKHEKKKKIFSSNK